MTCVLTSALLWQDHTPTLTCVCTVARLDLTVKVNQWRNSTPFPRLATVQFTILPNPVMSLLIWYPVIFTFLASSPHCWSTAMHHANVTFYAAHASLHDCSCYPSTIPYTTCTIWPAPHIRLMDDLWTTLFYFHFYFFSVTQGAMSWADWSQAITPHGQGLITLSPQMSLVLTFWFIIYI